MRIYNDCLEMVKETERDLAEMGIEYESETVQDQHLVGEDRMTKEISPYAYTIVSNDNGSFEELHKFLVYKKDKPEHIDFHKWLAAEAEERFIGCSNKNPGEAWEKYSSFWQQYIRKGKFAYTYVERIQEQLSYVIEELHDNPNSRQVVMTIYDRHQDLMNWGGLDRVPCSLTYHFLIRNKRLNLIYSQRSCDFFKFFQADVFFAISLQNNIADTLNIKCGNFTHFINSLHVFKKDVKGVF
jgi:thymidylate synthase